MDEHCLIFINIAKSYTKDDKCELKIFDNIIGYHNSTSNPNVHEFMWLGK